MDCRPRCETKDGKTTTTPGWLFSRTLEATDWPGLKIVHDDLVGFVRELKRTDGSELRTLGSLSLVRQLLAAGLVDRLKLVVCPLVLAQTGIEPTFEGLPDIGLRPALDQDPGWARPASGISTGRGTAVQRLVANRRVQAPWDPSFQREGSKTIHQRRSAQRIVLYVTTPPNNASSRWASRWKS